MNALHLWGHYWLPTVFLQNLRKQRHMLTKGFKKCVFSEWLCPCYEHLQPTFKNDKTIFSSRIMNVLELGSYAEIVLYSLMYFRAYLMFIPDSFVWTFLPFSEWKCLGVTSNLSFTQPVLSSLLCAWNYSGSRGQLGHMSLFSSSWNHLAYSPGHVPDRNIYMFPHQSIDSLRTGTMSSIIWVSALPQAKVSVIGFTWWKQRIPFLKCFRRASQVKGERWHFP